MMPHQNDREGQMGREWSWALSKSPVEERVAPTAVHKKCPKQEPAKLLPLKR
jgi:hypothetical protein